MAGERDAGRGALPPCRFRPRVHVRRWRWRPGGPGFPVRLGGGRRGAAGHRHGAGAGRVRARAAPEGRVLERAGTAVGRGRVHRRGAVRPRPARLHPAGRHLLRRRIGRGRGAGDRRRPAVQPGAHDRVPAEGKGLVRRHRGLHQPVLPGGGDPAGPARVGLGALALPRGIPEAGQGAGAGGTVPPGRPRDDPVPGSDRRQTGRRVRGRPSRWRPGPGSPGRTRGSGRTSGSRRACPGRAAEDAAGHRPAAGRWEAG